MMYLKTKLALVAIMLCSLFTYSQSLVCLEIDVDGEISTIVLTDNILQDTQDALAAEGYSSTVVECDEDVDLPDFEDLYGYDDIDFDDYGYGYDDFDFGTFVCLELSDGSFTAVPDFALADIQAQLADQGLTAEVIDCNDVPDDFGGGNGGYDGYDDYDDFDWGDYGYGYDDFDFGTFVCLELSDGSFLVVTDNMLADVQSDLADQGITSEVVNCEDVTFECDSIDSYDDFDWGDYGYGYDDFDFGTVVCLELSDGSFASVPDFAVADIQAVLTDQGITSEVIDCDDLPTDYGYGYDDIDFDDYGYGYGYDDIDWDNYGYGYDDYDFGNILCLEIIIDGDTSVIALPDVFLSDVQDELTAEGYASELVECSGNVDFPDFDDFDYGDDDGSDDGSDDDDDYGYGYDDIDFDDFDFGTIVCLELSDGSIIGVSENILADTQQTLADYGISSTVVECDEDGFGLVEEEDLEGMLAEREVVMEIAEMDIYPNPVSISSQVSLNFNSTKGQQLTLQVMDPYGLTTIKRNIRTENGNNAVSLNTSSLTPGLYTVSLYDENKVYTTQKLMIK